MKYKKEMKKAQELENKLLYVKAIKEVKEIYKWINYQ